MSALTVTFIAVAGVAILTYVLSRVIIQFVTDLFTKPNRQELVKIPSDYGMKYEDVKIKTDDGVELAAWLMRGRKNKVIILGHPGTFTRYGYSLKHETLMKSGYGKDVEFIPTAKHLVDAGYTVLMYDQRNHGESGSSDGPHDLPGHVYKDAVAVAEYMAQHKDFKGQEIGLLAICMNSMINSIAMTKEPERMRSANIKAMTVIQPHGIVSWLNKAGIPRWVVIAADRRYKKMGVTEMDGWDPVQYVKNIFVPVLFLQNVNDKTSDMEHMHDIYDAIPTEKEAIWIDETFDKDSMHRFHTYNWFNNKSNADRLISFFDKYLN